MKNNPLALMLVGILLISSLINLWLAYSYNSSLSQLRALQNEIAGVQNSRNTLNILFNELAEYSRKNPAITPMLQQVGILPPTAAKPGAPGMAAPVPAPVPTTAKPAGK